MRAFAPSTTDKKDQLEFVLYKMICAQEITLAEAQHAMATNWIEAWKRYMLRCRFKTRDEYIKGVV